MKKFSAERIYLKEIDLADINQRVMDWFSDEELMKFYTNSKKQITKESLIQSIIDGKESHNLYTFGIYDVVSDQLIGTMKLGPINHAQKTSDLVALIGDHAFLGKGLAVEAIKVGIQIAFEEYDLRKLFGGMYESNIASIKAYCRAGWIIEGRLKGHYWVDGKNEDRLLAACFNPKYFTKEEIEAVKEQEKGYL
ncbi:N-acetyltransferase [Solitalea longa]|uniref:N-acetyltransferase n=1 Tax=Solitalea longa TaxID=2079460 RepID=A0A2S5A951_9SPHI|nr:GNAT family protein [Solitalea longa]POY39120.1 N-acetyltransferase [Solitalea longa]